MHHFWVDFGKYTFWSIFDIFIRGYITFFCKKGSKNKVSRFERQSIVNFITSSTQYDIPYLDNIYRCFDQNSDIC